MGGLILDSSVAIRAERRNVTVLSLLESLDALGFGEDVGLSAIGVTELFHGIHRADTAARAADRHLFLEALLAHLPVFDYTLKIAELAGRIDGEQTMQGNIIPFPDLLIGATALSMGYSLLTTNVRHFRMIPGLTVIPF